MPIKQIIHVRMEALGFKVQEVRVAHLMYMKKIFSQERAYGKQQQQQQKLFLANCQTTWKVERGPGWGLSQQGGEVLTEVFELHPLRRRMKTEDVISIVLR